MEASERVYKSRIGFAIRNANLWIKEYDDVVDDPGVDDVFGMVLGYPAVAIASYIKSFKRLQRNSHGFLVDIS